MQRLRTLVILTTVTLTATAASAQPQETVIYFHMDAIGSVRMITDATGQEIARYDFLPFGSELNNPPGGAENQLKFTGQERDVETGSLGERSLDYFSSRNYQSQTGRFASPDDPGVIDPYDPRSLNLYGYAYNNPLRWVDPTGYEPECPYDACVTASDPADWRFEWESLKNLNQQVAQRSEETLLRLDQYQTLGASPFVPPIGRAAGLLGRFSGLIGLTGQYHHAVSRAIYKALEQHPRLRGIYSARDPRFVTQARDLAAHRGYDRFHRSLDNEIASWIRTNPNASRREFETYLRSVYQRPDVKARFPNGL
jgi:RHS repeat-associated protein